MTLSTQERAARCEHVISGYSDDDIYTNLVDFLADAIHLCKLKGHSFMDALESAVIHFDAENKSDGINRKPAKTIDQPLTSPHSGQPHGDKKLMHSVADQALDGFWQVVVQQFPEATTGDLSPLTTHRLTVAAEVAVTEWVWANVSQPSDE